MAKTCFFIGHRDTPEGIQPQLAAAVERHVVDYGVTDFVVGHYGAFDRMVARTVRTTKALHPWITLTLLLPYHPADRPTSLPEGFDSTYYPEGMENVPKRIAIVRANHYMVDHSDYLIAYAHHPASNAWDLVKYASSRERRGLIHVENLPMQ